MNPDRLAALEEERRFLLRSITDLDREHAVGDVDDHDYATLRDGYTARAATVLRAIEDGQAALPTGRRRRPWAMATWIVGTIAVAALAGWLVASNSGQRLPGQSISGAVPGNEVSTKLIEARQLLGVDPLQAIMRYQEVRELQPDNVEAVTYMGWLLVQTDPQTVEAGVERLREAITIDPTYADAHCFLAIASKRFLQPPDLDTAKREAQECLDNNPPSQMIGMIQGFVDELNAPTTTG